MIDTSELLGAPQVAGVVVSPIGLFREIESGMTVVSGGVVVPGAAGPAIADKLAGERAAEQRSTDAAASAATPDCGRWGFLAATGSEVVLTTTRPPKMVGRQLGELVARVPRSAVVGAELVGGWRHPGVYILSSAPLRLTFADGTAWTFEVSRFYRRHAKGVVHTLS
ncbi:MAG: hypothetical protein ACXVRH_05300, partial [Thermoleophilaceae bacterium]